MRRQTEIAPPALPTLRWQTRAATWSPRRTPRRVGTAGAAFFLLYGTLLLAQGTATTTELVALPAAPQYGETVTLIATVTPTTAVGWVSFFAEGTLVSSGEIIAGTARARSVVLSPGPHSVRAVYGGGSGYAPSASASLPYVVTAQSGAGFGAPAPDGFGPQSPYPVAVGDFNSDGSADVVSANVEDGSVTVRGGTGNGLFNWASTYPAGNTPFAVVTGEFNGDNETYVAVANISSNAVSVLLGSGGSKLLQAPVASTAGPTPYALAVGDFNVDGRADLVVANSTANAVSVLLGQGSGTFQPPISSGAGLEPVAVAVGDFNRDGRPDVAAANYVTRNVSVLLGNGDGTLQPAVHYAVGSADYAAPYSVAVGDFNRDGTPDLAVGNYKTANVSVLIGNGDGTFQTAAEYGAGLGPRSVAVSDFNGDGIADLVVANTSSTPGNETPATYLSLVSVLRGIGDGTFRPPIQYSTGSGPISVAVGDFNGDARADLVTANTGSADVSLLVATAPPSTTVTLSSAPNPATYGQAVTLTADVTPSTATGVVEFLDGTTVVGAAPLNASGRAEIDTLLLPSGTRQLRAIYAGVPGVWQSSRSAIVNHVVEPVSAAAFEPAVHYGVGTYAPSVAAGEFNGDGIADLAVSRIDLDGEDHRVEVRLGNRDGTFQSAANYAIAAAALAVADFNGDGWSDLAAAGGGVSVLLGNGDGTFQAPRTSAPGSFINNLAVGDFNEDGRPDVAVVVFHPSHVVSIWFGDGNGTFYAVAHYVTGEGSLTAIAVGDLDGNGTADLVVSDSHSDHVSVLLGNGNGTFEQPVSTSVFYPTSVAVGDLDADGNTDVVVANGADDHVSVLLGRGDGTLQPATSHFVGLHPTFVVTADFDGDGKLDVAAARPSATISILLGAIGHNGKWTLRAPHNYDIGFQAAELVVGDFNADGRADLAIAMGQYLPGGLTILLGTSARSTSTSLAAGPSPSRYGQSVTLTASVSPSNAAGEIMFLDGTTVLGVGTVNTSGRAQISTSQLPSGRHSLRARYTGVAGSWLPSESAVVDHVVHAAGSTGFAAPRHYTAGTEPNSVAVGDFNSDGRADLAVANVGSHEVSVLLGNANGTFQAAVSYSAGSHPFAVAVGDFNGDSKPDLAVANIGSAAVSVLPGYGNGTFAAPLSSAAGTTPYALAVADFNADGKADLVVANSSGNAVSVLLGHGTGTFQAAVPYSAGIEPVAVAIGDFNRDDVPDVAAANYVTRNVSVLMGTGDGTLEAAVHYATGSADYASPYSVAIGDFDGDGAADLAVATYKTANVSVLLGSGDGTFREASNFAAGLGPHSVAVGDFNGDGIADLTVANTSSTPGNETPATFLSIVGILLGKGDGSFQAPTNHAVGSGPTSVAVGEFNNDARADLAVVNSASGDVSVLLATATRRGRLPPR
jgi:hypothetical protein